MGWVADVTEALGRPMSDDEFVMGARVAAAGGATKDILQILQAQPEVKPERTVRYEPGGRGKVQRIP